MKKQEGNGSRRMPTHPTHTLPPKLWSIIIAVMFIAIAFFNQCEAASNSVRIMTYNTHLLTEIMKCGSPPSPECAMSPTNEFTRKAASRIAPILKVGYFDILALNEVWDEDDGKDVLTKALQGVYPHYVKYVDVFGGGTEEDSGLMLFSKFPFESLPDTFFASEDSTSSYGTDSNRIAYVKFDDCESSDCWAAKGAILVRLKHPSSGRIINVVATHTQADYDDSNYSSARSRQLRQILGQCETGMAQSPDNPPLIHKTLRPSLGNGESLCAWTNQQWLLLLGDLNIKGEGGVGKAVHPARAPSQGPQEWWNRIGFSAANSPATGYALYDPWAETSSETDKGLTNGDERLDYILIARRTKTLAGAVSPDVCVQHVWNPPEFDGLSDHRPLAADLNLSAEQCNPRLAYIPTAREIGSTSTDQGKAGKRLTGKITYPGSMQWWRLDKPGTYTIALSPQAVAHGVTIEAYEASNLSRPLGGAYQLGESNMKACSYVNPHTGALGRCESVPGQEFVLPKAPIYLRVFNPNRDWSGQYWIAIHRHGCKSRSDSCHLLPNEPRVFNFPPAGTPLNETDTAWFSVSIEQQADSGNPQKLRFYAENAASGAWVEPAITLHDVSGQGVVSSIDGQPLSGPIVTTAPFGGQRIAREGRTRTNAKYYMTVRRGNVSRTQHLRVGWQTNLTLLGGSAVGHAGASLVCNDETNPEGGVDEIRLEVNIDNTGWQTRGTSEFDCNDSWDGRNWDNGLGLIRYLESVQLRLIEVDENADNDVSPVWELGTWNLDTDTKKVGAPVAAAQPFYWADGNYTLNLNIGKWLNQ
jgi:endonuclease/exonuclease/phosphatase family metal-dependent hydrolase